MKEMLLKRKYLPLTGNYSTVRQAGLILHIICLKQVTSRPILWASATMLKIGGGGLTYCQTCYYSSFCILCSMESWCKKKITSFFYKHSECGAGCKKAICLVFSVFQARIPLYLQYWLQTVLKSLFGEWATVSFMSLIPSSTFSMRKERWLEESTSRQQQILVCHSIKFIYLFI